MSKRAAHESVPADDGPFWRRQTMDWIKEHRPEYVRGDDATPVGERLLTALGVASYLDAEEEAGLIKSAHQERVRRVQKWSRSFHEEAVLFMEMGGYSGVKLLLESAKKDERIAGAATAKRGLRKKQAEQLTDEPLEPVGADGRQSRDNGVAGDELESAVLVELGNHGSW